VSVLQDAADRFPSLFIDLSCERVCLAADSRIADEISLHSTRQTDRQTDGPSDRFLQIRLVLIIIQYSGRGFQTTAECTIQRLARAH